jgi:cell surface protein SprA
VLRFGSLDLVRGEWRIYNKPLSTTSESGTLEVSAVNIEENNNKQPVNYVVPPGISRVTDPSQPQLTEANEQALNMVVKNLSAGESKAIYRNTVLDLRQYKHLQMFVHANHLVNDATDLKDNQLAVFIRMGSDYKNNYYEYVIPLKLTPDRSDYNKYNVDDCRAVWPAENMLNVDLSIFTKVKKARNMARAMGTSSYTTLYSDYDPDQPNNRVSVMGNPTLGEIKTMMIGVRNLSGSIKSGEVWINELRLQDVVNSGGWAASGALNMQLSDVGTLNLTGKIITEGFGGLEDGVAARTTDDYKTYSLTTTIELGKLFPDKLKVTAPLYYSVTKEITKPKYNPLDTDMNLDDALEAANKQERDSIENIAVTKSTSTNFSLSNVRFDIKTKRHPMPYDPANFSFSYSHSHRHTSGKTTVYENDDQWRGSLNYSYTPVYKPWEPFKKSKSKSKWMALPKAFGLNWLPQNITFNSEMSRSYYELQERDMDDLSGSSLPVTFNSQFLWNRDFSLRWDLTKNLHMNFQSGTQAEIEEPYSDKPINKDLYPDRYSAWKDSVWTSIKHFGRPLDYRQTFTASYQLPLNKLPIFDWVNADANYTATYNWVRGREKEDGTSLGNTISNNRQITVNSTLNMETLYNHFPFLKKANDRFKKAIPKSQPKKNDKKNVSSGSAAGKDKAAGNKEAAKLPKNKNAFEKELKLLPDTTITVAHNKKSKRLVVTAKTKDGRSYPIKYKVVDQNKIRIKSNDSTTIKLTVLAKPPLDDERWYRTAQSAARFLMMVRSIGISYRNQYSMSLSGFMPEVGDAFGQRTGGVMAPGLGFAFGLTDDSFLDKAIDNGWLLMADSISTPATTNKTEDLQLRATLEPLRDLKIDLNASRTESRSRRIQYMYKGMPTTQTGSFNMTTISISSALESMGDANNGYPSAAFDRFCDALPRFQQMASAHYGAEVDKYSAVVMIPAFLDSYTGSGGGSLDLIPALTKLLPNWTIRYSGLSKLKWFNEHFKSVNINHSYKSVFALGSYTSSSETASMLGWNVPTVSINESFSPLIGADVTFHNNLTLKAEYRRTRVLNLSMTSVQINESRSNDLVIGMGYKISNFRLFGAGTSRKIKKAQGGSKSKKDANSQKQTANSKKAGVNHDLNMRLDISLRDQAAITRDIATRSSSASSGNSALKVSFMADYTLSRLLTISAYYERQTNKPLLSSSSYPTTTHDFGLSMKFSLTR